MMLRIPHAQAKPRRDQARRLDVAATIVAETSSTGVCHLASNHSAGLDYRTAEVFVAEGAKIVISGRRLPEGEAAPEEVP
ncbi:hypothetical protein [uncultured Bradyrhizobium sp.]|jgi:3-polyprenyl-4-hydroxybenzoate decarboxylase|uniref:hypothetical protein n=1 Tax=uncultured Bradyrhizobium sp. TaxID=199684 RepID=UPI0026068915|nr:hypothetical protein [uncultured Bradyrhizobium sp.]